MSSTDPAEKASSTTWQWDKWKKPIADALGLKDLTDDRILVVDNRSTEVKNCEKLQILTGHDWKYLKLKEENSYFLSGKAAELQKVAELLKDKIKFQYTTQPSRPARIVIKSRDLEHSHLESLLGAATKIASTATPT